MEHVINVITKRIQELNDNIASNGEQLIVLNNKVSRMTSYVSELKAQLKELEEHLIRIVK